MDASQLTITVPKCLTNLSLVRSKRNRPVRIVVGKAPGEPEHGERSWFHCIVAGGTPGLKVVVVLSGVRSRWKGSLTTVVREDSTWRLLDARMVKEKDGLMDISFDYTFTGPRTVQFARFVPYAVDGLRETIGQLKMDSRTRDRGNKGVYFTSEVALPRNANHPEVFLLTVSGQDPYCGDKREDRIPGLFGGSRLSAPKEFKNKHVVVMVARVDSWDAESSHYMDAFLKFITGKDPRAAALRKRYVFKIIPNLPTAPGAGYPTDFDNVDATTHPGLYVLRKVVLHAVRSDLGLRAFVDVRGGERRTATVYGPLFSTTIERTNAAVFPGLIAANCSAEFVEGFAFGVGDDRNAPVRRMPMLHHEVHRWSGVPLCYTLELGGVRVEEAPLKTCQHVARATATALLDLVSQNPAPVHISGAWAGAWKRTRSVVEKYFPGKELKAPLEVTVVGSRLLFDPEVPWPVIKFTPAKHVMSRRKVTIYERAGAGLDGMAYLQRKSSSSLPPNTMAQAGFHNVRRRKTRDWTIQWTAMHPAWNDISKFSRYQRLNHFPNAYALTRKDSLWDHVAAMREKFGEEEFGFLPECFVVPRDLVRLKEAMAQSSEKWIFKPSGGRCGVGIHIIDKFSDLRLPVWDNTAAQKGKNQGVTQQTQGVVQRYLPRPMLIDGKKFDLRLYVLVTSYAPLRAYLMDNGLARFCAEQYRQDATNNLSAHLTNVTFNKKHPGYARNQTADVDDFGGVWSLKGLRRRLRAMSLDDDAVFADVTDVIVKALIACMPSISPGVKENMPYPGNCFEFYGFDVMLDAGLKPHLLEANAFPSVACQTPMDHLIKGQLTSELLTIIGVVPTAFRTREDRLHSSGHPMDLSEGQRARLEMRRAERFNMIFPVADGRYDFLFDGRDTGYTTDELDMIFRPSEQSETSEESYYESDDDSGAGLAALLDNDDNDEEEEEKEAEGGGEDGVGVKGGAPPGGAAPSAPKPRGLLSLLCCWGRTPPVEPEPEQVWENLGESTHVPDDVTLPLLFDTVHTRWHVDCPPVELRQEAKRRAKANRQRRLDQKRALASAPAPSAGSSASNGSDSDDSHSNSSPGSYEDDEDDDDDEGAASKAEHDTPEASASSHSSGFDSSEASGSP